MSSNRQIVKAAKMAVTSANASALTRAVVKAAAPRVVQSVTSALKSKGNSSKVNRTRGGQRPTFVTEDHWTTQVTTPAAYTARWGSGSRPLRVRQSEMVGAIKKDGSWWPFGESGFQVKKYQINPADNRTFPWLSNIAKLFDKYKFHNLAFRFVNCASTAKPGTFLMGVDYDTLDSAPTSEVAFSQLAKYSAGPIFQPHGMTIPLSHPGNSSWLYTYDFNTSANDPKTYNLGNLFIGLAATDADWNSGTVGYLFVDYDVEFIDKNPTALVSKKDDDASADTVEYRTGIANYAGNEELDWSTGAEMAAFLDTDGHDYVIKAPAGGHLPAGTKVLFSCVATYDTGTASVDLTLGEGVVAEDREHVVTTSDNGSMVSYICEFTLGSDIPAGFTVAATNVSNMSTSIEASTAQITVVIPTTVAINP